MSTIRVTSPYDHRFLQEVKLHTKNDVDSALQLATQVYEDQTQWLPKYKRIEILEKAIVLMSNEQESLTLLVASEGGKPYVDAKVEVERAINGIKVAIEHLGSFSGKEIAMGHTQSSANRIAYTSKEPIGIVVAISAFNHPLNLAIHQMIPAIAVGSPVIIKPSESTPLSALRLVEILYEAGLAKAWCQVLVCEREASEYLATHAKVDYLSFIGSAKVGWYLNSKVAPGTRVGLEHGGVAPVIVEADADIKEVIPSLIKGGFYHAGQVCVSVQRIYVHEDICDEVSAQLAQKAAQLIVGDPLDPKTEVGPLISTKEVDRIEAWVDEAIAQGAQCLCGGKRLSDTCFAPTVLLNPSAQAKVSTHEVFGPVICIYTYNNIEQAFKEANSLEFSFQASVFSKNIDTALLAVRRLNATAVMVNDHTAFRVDWMPFGGAKASGLGMGGIPYSMDEMSKEKLMVIKSDVITA